MLVAKIRKTIRIPESHFKMMDLLIESKSGVCYAECVRVALDRLISRDLKLLKDYESKIDGIKPETKEKEIKQKKIDEFF